MRPGRESGVRRALLGLALLTLAAGCATTGPERRSSSREITREEIEAADGASTAFDVVQRLRPQWFRYRGAASMTREGAIVVYVDGIRSGSVIGDGSSPTSANPLVRIPRSRLQRLVFLGASGATQKFGTGHAHGAIEVFTRR